MTKESEPLMIRHLRPATQETPGCGSGLMRRLETQEGRTPQASPRARQRPAPQLLAAGPGGPSYSACFRPSADRMGALGACLAQRFHGNAQKHPRGHAQDV